MKYIKGNQDYKLSECKMIKLRIYDNKGYAETPWANRFESLDEAVLQNNIIGLMPYFSYGAVLPTTSRYNLNDIDVLTLHPDIWEEYINDDIIDNDGNFIYKNTELK